MSDVFLTHTNACMILCCRQFSSGSSEHSRSKDAE